MGLVVRKIEYAKWTQRDILKGAAPSADAITNCMKTKRNTLSVWLIKSISELEDAVLAITAQLDHLDTIDVVSMDSNLLKQNNLALECNKGLTPYKDFSDRHRDVINLDYHSLGHMANVIIESIKQDQRKRYTKSRLRALITKAVHDGKVELSDLKPHVKKKISTRESS